MGHSLGGRTHVSIAPLVRVLLAMVFDLLDRWCGPFRANFAVFAILGQFRKRISPWGEGLARMER